MTTTTTTTYPFPEPETRPDPRVFMGEGQAYLVGETLFLRGLEAEDARRPAAWRSAPYPVNAERAGELIKEMMERDSPGEQFLVACRRSDGLPVGSVRLNAWPGTDPTNRISLHADPALPGGDEIRTESLRLIYEWGFGEGEIGKFTLEFDSGRESLRRAAEALGMRHGATWRDGIWRDGRWYDRVMYEGFHPAWLRRIGDPGNGIDHARAVDDPIRWRPRQHPTFGDPGATVPTNAILVGPRVYLRPLEITDADSVGAERAEPDTIMGTRFPWSRTAFAQFTRGIARTDPPDWPRFAVCLREDGRHIGTNGLIRLNRINRSAESESWFHEPAFRGGGYGTEAKHLLLAYGFNTLGLHSVYSWVWGPNTRSAAALRRQGYRDAGRMLWAGTHGGEYTHAGMFDLLADEWREMDARAGQVPAGDAS